MKYLQAPHQTPPSRAITTTPTLPTAAPHPPLHHSLPGGKPHRTLSTSPCGCNRHASPCSHFPSELISSTISWAPFVFRQPTYEGFSSFAYRSAQQYSARKAVNVSTTGCGKVRYHARCKTHLPLWIRSSSIYRVATYDRRLLAASMPLLLLRQLPLLVTGLKKASPTTVSEWSSRMAH